MRSMNSIRESCKSIEELDLAGNKLTDLIEVFKILQCTPNLKFLNLSENDLSKSWPVAMANTTNYPSSSSSNTFSPYLQAPSQQQVAWSASSMTLNSHLNGNTRACLAPITQNQQQVGIVARRHSTLGQQTSATRLRQQNNATNPSSSSAAASSSSSPSTTSFRTNKSNEARRLASAAVAQTKKTSPTIATKLTMKNSKNSSKNINNPTDLSSTINQRNHRTGTTSTMQLVRSVSSLSAKDVRVASRLNNLRTSCSSSRRQTTQDEFESKKLRNSSSSLSNPIETKGSTTSTSIQSSSTSPNLRFLCNSPHASDKINELLPSKETNPNQVKTMTTINKPQQGKLFVETIAETEHELEMSDNNNQVATTATNSTSNLQSAIIIKQQQNQRNSTGTSIGRLNNPTSSTTTTTTTSNFRRTFESIKALALNNTGCQWKVVCSILNRMPNLEELHLSLNNYERIDLDPIEFKHYSLKRLYLCNNPKLTNWQELNKLLLAFPSLEALSIADCNISQIPENLDRAREWRKLCGLNINGWPIKEWPVIERLNQLPSLIDLKCRNLDIFNSIDEPRSHLIARLPKLQRLNGSEIEEREHAEKAFLRFFMANSHLERPSRFHELIQIHGEVIPTIDVDVDLSPPSQASIRVVYLNRNYFKEENQDDIMMSEDFLNKLLDHNNLDNQQPNSIDSMEVDSNNKLTRLFKDEGQEVIAMEVDLRQSVRKFKSSLAQLFGLSSQNLILYYIDHEMMSFIGPELIKHNQKKLWNYNVQDGDQFIVEEV